MTPRSMGNRPEVALLTEDLLADAGPDRYVPQEDRYLPQEDRYLPEEER